MPSPVGHALGGIAAGWHAGGRHDLPSAIVLAVVAVAPDCDLLLGVHRGISHSLGAACAAGLVAWIASRQPRWGLAIALAWASHVGLDWLSNDTRPPIGVMALWPITHDYYKAAVEIFPPVSRKYWEARFWKYNAHALFAELAILGPAALAVVWSTRRRHR
jgi:membrane-bound metal-dependent hydrolase YbcI (DUF457 family)